MDKFKTMPRKVKGGILVSVIVLFVALLTVGVKAALAAPDPSTAEPYTITVDWQDQGNAYNTRPESLEFTILADNYDTYDYDELATLTIQPDSNGVWSGTASVPRKSLGGEDLEISYIRVSPPSGYDYYSSISNSGATVTMTNRAPDPNSVEPYTVTVNWADGNNAYNTRPASLEFEVLDEYGENTYATLTIQPGGNGVWSGTTSVPTRTIGGDELMNNGATLSSAPSGYNAQYSNGDGSTTATMVYQGTTGCISGVSRIGFQRYGGPLPSAANFILTSTTEGTEIARRTVDLTDSNVATWDGTAVYVLVWTPADNIQSPSNGTYTMQVEAENYSPSWNNSDKQTIYSGDTGNGYFSLKFDPVLPEEPWTFSVNWDDNNNPGRPSQVELCYEPEQSGMSEELFNRLSGTVRLTAEDSWTKVVSLPSEYLGTPLTYRVYTKTLPPITEEFAEAYLDLDPTFPSVDTLYALDGISVDNTNHTAAVAFSADEDAFVTVEANNSMPYWLSHVYFNWDDAGHEDARPDTLTFTTTNGGNTTGRQSIPTSGVKLQNVVYPRDSNGIVTVEQPEGYSATIAVQRNAANATSSISVADLIDASGDFFGGAYITLTYTGSSAEPEVGNLSITKTVAGDGADQSQLFPFTITVNGAGSDTYGDLTFVNDVATTSLGHNQTVTATGLPADAAYSVSEGTVENYTPSWTNQSGSIVANQTTAVSCLNTYSAPVASTGGLSITKAVAGDGADQSQSFQFTITVAGAGSETYDGVQFTNDVATISLTHGQTTTITGLPANASYSVAEGTVENYTPSWSNQSGTITAGQTTAVSCTNTYTAPAPPVQPTTVPITLTRDDDDPTGDPITLTLVETLPEEIDLENVDTSDLNLVVTPPVPGEPRSYPPTADPVTNSFVYTFPIDDDETMTVPIVEGSDVTITNTSPGDDITQDPSSPTTQTGQMLVMQSITHGTPIPPITVSASPKAAPAHPQRNQGWIRVNTNPNVNTAVSYQAFKVFDAAVAYDSVSGNYNGTHIEWESDAVKAAVMGFLRNAENGTEYTSWLATKYGKDANAITAGDQELAQNAAEWIAKKIGESDEDTTANTTPKTTKGDTFASKLATVLRNYGLAPIPVPANTVTPVEQGYYVVATATSTIDDGEAGTAPIWAPVPQTGYTVEEKVSKPVFNKQVKDNTDVTDAFGKVADASTGQALDFRLTTTLPANVKAFPSYPLTIVDDLPDGMDPLELNQANGYSVHLGEADITSQVVATSSQDGTLTFSIANALALDGVDGNSVITVDYKAKLNANSVKGNEGNTNTATLTYPADTMTATTAQLTSSAKVLTYQLRVDKVDEANRLNVDGAQFSAKTTIGSTEYWVAQDGTPTTDASQKGMWTTANGTLTIPGIDEGAYDIIEAQAPEHYETIAQPLHVVIDATKDYAGGTLTSLTATASGANGTLVSNPSPTQDGVVGTDTATGIVRVRISDVKQIVLPLTGMPVKTLGIIVGVGIAIASVVAFLVKRRKEKDEDELLYE